MEQAMCMQEARKMDDSVDDSLISRFTDASSQVCPEGVNAEVECHPTTNEVGKNSASISQANSLY